MTSCVLTTLQDGVMKVTLDSPKANALTLEMISGLQAAFKEAARLVEVRCVLLGGAGGAFSSGQDVSQILQAEGSSFRRHLQGTYNPLILQIRRLEKPVLAAISGTAAGAALGIALACDLRIASEQARFVVGFSGIGLAPDSGVSLFLPALIGSGRAAEYMYSNEPISAGQALEWGLVNRLVPAAELDERAWQWAAALAQGPTRAMSLAKRALNKAIYAELEEVLDYEAHLQEIARHSPEHQEGVKAFLEKRKPNFPP